MTEQEYRQCLCYMSKVWGIKFNETQEKISYPHFKDFNKQDFINCIRSMSHLDHCPTGRDILINLTKTTKNDKYWLGVPIIQGQDKNKIEQINDLLKEFD